MIKQFNPSCQFRTTGQHLEGSLSIATICRCLPPMSTGRESPKQWAPVISRHAGAIVQNVERAYRPHPRAPRPLRDAWERARTDRSSDIRSETDLAGSASDGLRRSCLPCGSGDGGRSEQAARVNDRRWFRDAEM